MARKFLISAAALFGLALLISLYPSDAAAGANDDGAGAAQVMVRSGLHDGFARIVFRWKRLPVFHTSGDNALVEIRFARPLRADLEPLLRSMGAWVKNAEILDDNQTVRLQLARAFELRSFPLGNMAVIDLIDPDAAVSAAATEQAATLLPEVASLAPAAGPSSADPVLLPAPPKPAARAAAEPPAIVAGKPATLPSTAPTPPPAPQPETVVAEKPAMVSRAEPPTPAPPQIAPPIHVESKDHGSFSRLIFTWNDAIDYEVERTGGTVTVLFDGPVEIDLVSLRRGLPKRFSSVDSVLSDGKLLLQIGIGEALRLRHFQKGTRIVLDALEVPGADVASRPAWASQDVIAKPDSETALKTRAEESATRHESAATPSAAAPVSMAGLYGSAGKAAAEPEPEPERQPTAMEEALTAKLPPAPPLTVATEAISGGMRLRLLWDRRIGASVFRRMGYLWIVFDVPRIVDLGALGMSDGMTGTITSADQLRAPGATVLRFGIASDLWPRVARSGSTWLVELTDAPLPPAKPLLVRAEPSAKGGARVLVPTPGAGRTITFDDPEVGDTLVVVPVSEPGVGVKTGRAFVQFDIMASAQGLAFKTRADDVAIDTKVTGVEVTSPRELYMSADTIMNAGRLAEVSDGLKTAMGPLFEYEDWRRDDLGKYLHAKRHLQHAVVSAGIEVRTERRLSLANFHFAHGLAEDAIGVIRRIAEEDPQSLERPDFLALRGATLMLLGRAEEAAADLNRDILDGDMDVTLWRAALTATRGDWEGADSAFAISGPAFERLPSDLRARFGLLAAHAALAVGNYHRVNRLVERIEAEAPNPNDRMEARYLRATAYQRTGKTEAALEYFEALAVDGSRPVRARSELSRVELMLYLGRMNRSDAIEALERLRHAWRGDSFEQLLLRRLAELYREEQNYLNALQAMRDAVENFPKSAATPAVNDQMQRMFADLFIDGGADTLSPLTALSLYYEFGDLSEDGAAGGRIAEGLANRLVDVDFLDRASELLERQLDVVAGVDNARIGAHLAVIQLLDQEPAQALETLKRSRGEGAGVPVALMEERRHLEARALSALGDNAAALALLEKDSTRAAVLLRADIHWRSEQWAEAGVELGRAFDHAGGDIAVDEQHLVMRQVVALMLSGDSSGLDRMRGKYSDGMAASVYKNAFDLITRSTDTDAVPVHDLPKTLANIEGAEAFLRTYRDSPPADGANAVN